MDWIFSRKRAIPITPNLVRKLHSLAQGGTTGDAGVRVVPTPAHETPAAMELLCGNYRQASENEAVPILLIVATFVFDFLCIHPFRDGNGRLARLLTTLLLQSQGFQLARYVSLERMVETRRDEYYRVLGECSRGWAEGRNEILPWWNYFLGLVRGAYQEFEIQVESSAARPAKGDLVRRTVLAQREEFTLADLSAQLPTASRQLIKQVLSDLKKGGQIQLSGRGRSARWLSSK